MRTKIKAVKKAVLRAEDTAKGEFIPVGSLP